MVNTSAIYVELARLTRVQSSVCAIFHFMVGCYSGSPEGQCSADLTAPRAPPQRTTRPARPHPGVNRGGCVLGTVTHLEATFDPRALFSTPE